MLDQHRHALVIDHQLRPLFGFFQAHTLPYGLYVAAEAFTDYQLLEATHLARIARALDPVIAFFQPAALSAA